jgi:hypothetical protein
MAQLDDAALSDPAWIVHRYDLAGDAFVMRRFPREDHRLVPFLTDEYLGPPPPEPDWATPIQAGALGRPGPIHFILHSAFCNSTLLTRALDHPGLAMGLSEPVVLNDFVGLRRRGEIAMPAFGQRCDAALSLLSRPWENGEAVVVKPSCIVNPLAGGLLGLRPEAKAIVMHTRLELFLGSVARKGLWARLWARELAEGFFRDGILAPLGMEPSDLPRLTDLQAAAASWLGQQVVFADLAKRYGPERIRGLEAEQLYPDPAPVLRQVADHFGLSRDTGLRDALARAAALRRHSKTGAEFDMAARRGEQELATAAHREEIEAVSEWGRQCAARAGVPLDLPYPILRRAGRQSGID